MAPEAALTSGDQLLPMSEHARVGDTVYLRLREAIFAGVLTSGARLSVPALASQLQVSRSPVREAVQRLIREQLAIEQPRRGAVVATVDVDDLVAMYEVREVLEGLVGRLAAAGSDPSLVGTLRRNLDLDHEASKDGDLAKHLELDLDFHHLIRSASGNEEAIRQLDSIQTRVRLAMRTTVVSAGPIQAIHDHEAILAAIQAGDSTEAEQRSREHIARLRNVLSSRGSLARAAR